MANELVILNTTDLAYTSLRVLMRAVDDKVAGAPKVYYPTGNALEVWGTDGRVVTDYLITPTDLNGFILGVPFAFATPGRYWMYLTDLSGTIIYNYQCVLWTGTSEALPFTAAGYTALGSILGTVLTETESGYLSTAFKKLFDVAVPVLTVASVNQSADNNTLLEAINAKTTNLPDSPDTINPAIEADNAIRESIHPQE
ncbi:MAG TPA: hypothetical protein DDW84_00110 [Phycisphaerales bacterium]|nr:MAG: hypothetical protein A2Y13_02045 [Planctomycetes bacterium GWC2_45_44]HBG77240.1 hypothetical protein [Phycisphaerales bacterium]HBR19203.1 hypothetical protein [Phycisphaerales bacterium]